MARKDNFTELEISVLIEEFSLNKEALQSRQKNSVTNKLKAGIWRKITERINAVGGGRRTTQELKKKIRKLLSQARQDVSARKIIRTGGGPPQKEGAYTAVLEEAIGMEKSDLIRGIDGGCDADDGSIFGQDRISFSFPSPSSNAKVLDESCAYDISMDNIDGKYSRRYKKAQEGSVRLRKALQGSVRLRKALQGSARLIENTTSSGTVDQIASEADSQQAPKRQKLFCSTPVSANH
ncbi:hypothetical protein RRG08_019255 [Elysia crispata]|uniref:Myb/SANT-like DNA-binding domain-containing protein n=1 Tax=Elysia crispata TaxID=231223 RepID=A0AAE1D527_9GAST|nr:hypothetical protein RRG08_019255 [Elysia crispata]